MRPTLRLCVSQQENEVPYQFKATGLHVYSFEEALYHVYHHWKQSVDDFLSDAFLAWVNDMLGLSYLAARMKEIARMDAFHRRVIAFLRLADYFDDAALRRLSDELVQWGKRLEWEKLKERADYLMGRGEPDKAVALYKRALQYDENIALRNNLGVAYMKLEAYGDAFKQLDRALAMDKNNIALWLHYAEAAIYCRFFDDAAHALQEAERIALPSKPSGSDGWLRSDIPFLNGLLYFEQNDFTRSIACFEEAIAMNAAPEPHYVYRLADVYVRMRQYDKALFVLDQCTERDAAFFEKEAELFAAANNMPAAVRSIQKAISKSQNDRSSGTPEDAALWMKLATYHRLDYDLNKANAAITKALSIDPENDRARLENARIKKGMGRTREYQAVLNGILRGFRQRYRELGV